MFALAQPAPPRTAEVAAEAALAAAEARSLLRDREWRRWRWQQGGEGRRAGTAAVAEDGPEVALAASAEVIVAAAVDDGAARRMPS